MTRRCGRAGNHPPGTAAQAQQLPRPGRGDSRAAPRGAARGRRNARLGCGVAGRVRSSAGRRRRARHALREPEPRRRRRGRRARRGRGRSGRRDGGLQPARTAAAGPGIEPPYNRSVGATGASRGGSMFPPADCRPREPVHAASRRPAEDLDGAREVPVAPRSSRSTGGGRRSRRRGARRVAELQQARLTGVRFKVPADRGGHPRRRPRRAPRPRPSASRCLILMGPSRRARAPRPAAVEVGRVDGLALLVQAGLAGGGERADLQPQNLADDECRMVVSPSTIRALGREGRDDSGAAVPDSGSRAAGVENVTGHSGPGSGSQPKHTSRGAPTATHFGEPAEAGGEARAAATAGRLVTGQALEWRGRGAAALDVLSPCRKRSFATHADRLRRVSTTTDGSQFREFVTREVQQRTGQSFSRWRSVSAPT